MSEEKYRMKCTVVTPECKVLEMPINEIILSMLDGKIGILPGHAPLLCELKPDAIKYKDLNWDEYHLFVDGGFAHVRDNEVIILTPSVIKPGQIESLSARKSLEDAFAMSKVGLGQAQKRQDAIERARQIMAFADTRYQ